MPLDNTQPSDSVHEVQYQWMQRVPHLYKGTCMLVSDVKIVGTMDGGESVVINMTCLCPLETIEKICSTIRGDLHDMGSGIDFEISFKDMDI